MSVVGWSANLVDPNWRPILPLFQFRLELPPIVTSGVQELFFPEGQDSVLDVSSSSKFEYAQELRELLPKESEKDFLMFDEVEAAFLRLELTYIQRTSSLQRFGNALFREQLAFAWFRTRALPAYLMASSKADTNFIESFAANDDAVKLKQNEDEAASPDDGRLLRTKTTTPEVLSRSPPPELLIWDDKTSQLVRWLLHGLFNPSDDLPRVGQRVCILEMSSEFLNGAEGYFEGFHPDRVHFPDRIQVRLVFPTSVVNKVQSEKNTTIVTIPCNKVVRFPDSSDVISMRRLREAAAAGCAPAAAWMAKFLPFLSNFGFVSQRGEDTDITMAMLIDRFKQASFNLCQGTSFFMDPVNAYLERKLRHARKKIRPEAVAPTKKYVKIFRGGEYYVMMREGRSSRLCLIRMVTWFKNGYSYSAKVVFLDDDVSPSKTARAERVGIITIPDLGMLIPKEEFQDHPPITSGVVDSSYADTRDDYSSEAYHKDTGEILECLAVSFPEFKLHGKVPLRPNSEKEYTVRNALNGKSLQFTEIDLGMSFKPFFSEDLFPSWGIEKRTRLGKSAALEELNRCFFIHLGLALDLHPFALQAIFREHSQLMMTRTKVIVATRCCVLHSVCVLHLLLLTRPQEALSKKENEDDPQFDELWQYQASMRSVLQSAALVEGSVLPAVWPQELDSVRILILAVGHDGKTPPTYGPLPSSSPCFYPRPPSQSHDEWTGTDVILKLEGAHFTLLRPRAEFVTLPIDAILGLFDIDNERCPLHLQTNVSGRIAQEAGRPKSLGELYRQHCPAPPPAAAVAPPSVAPAPAPAPAPSPAQAELKLLPPAAAAAAPADAAASAAALLSSLSLIDPAAEAIPYD